MEKSRECTMRMLKVKEKHPRRNEEGRAQWTVTISVSIALQNQSWSSLCNVIRRNLSFRRVRIKTNVVLNIIVLILKNYHPSQHPPVIVGKHTWINKGEPKKSLQYWFWTIFFILVCGYKPKLSVKFPNKFVRS